MVAVWKCAALAMIAIGGMGIAALLCAVATSWVVVAERVVSVAIYAATDLSVGDGGDRRRCAAWLLTVVLVAVVRSVHPVGDAFGKVLYFLIIDFVMPRDACTRRRSAPSLVLGAMYWLSACSDASAYYGYDEASLVMQGIYYVVLLVGFQCIQKGIDASSLTTSDYILLAGTVFNSVTYTFFQIAMLPVHVFVRSLLLVLLRRPIMKSIVPGAKCLYGDGDDGWHLVVLVCLCAMELQPAFMLAGASLRSMEFYLLVALQEANAVLKNLGIFYWLYCETLAFIGRPVCEKLRQESDARRRVVAPCDCIAELVAPFVVSVYVILTNPRARPLLAMGVALVTRIVFTVLEVHIERRRALFSGDQTPVGEVVISITAHVESYRAAMLSVVLALQWALFVMYACWVV